MTTTTHHRRMFPHQRHTGEDTSASTTAAAVRAAEDERAPSLLASRALAALRVGFGLTFLWAFLDKTFALGFATGRDPGTGAVDRLGDAAWIHGGSPTKGFLAFGADGPMSGLYHSIAGAAWADWLFMIGLLGIGLALTLGIGMRVAAACGAVLYVLMWSVVLPPANNPVLDEHLLGALTLVVLALLGAGDTWGLGDRWRSTDLVRSHPVLR